jgi:DNA mismatch repair protein MutL
MPYDHIQKLPENLISQIAAGEVIERPASVLKELLDNAIDAGSTKIEARVDKGGVARVEVLDNGQGIPEEDLALAFERHATSKIRSFDDLMEAMTMGFRGEALASMASVSRASITTKREGERVGRRLACENGVLGEIEPAACDVGTRVQIQDLFFFVPARRKFLKSDSTEFAHCRAAFLRSALSRPDIAFTLYRDNKKSLSFPAQTPRERAEAVLGPQVAQRLAPLDAESGFLRLEGFAAPVRALPTGQDSQWLFVNRRYTRDRILASAAREALAETQGLGREKDVAFIAFLSVPSSEIDVNAHPAKTETRFKDSRGARQFLKNALLATFEALPKPEGADAAEEEDIFAPNAASEPPASGRDWLARSPSAFGGGSSGASHAPWRESGGYSRPSGPGSGHGSQGSPFARQGGFGGGAGGSRSGDLDSWRPASPAGFPDNWPPAPASGFGGRDALADQGALDAGANSDSAQGSADAGEAFPHAGDVAFLEGPVQLPASGAWLVDAPDGAVLIPLSAVSAANLAGALACAALSGEALSDALLEPALAPLSASQLLGLAPWRAPLEALGAKIEAEADFWRATALPDGLGGVDWLGACEALSTRSLPDDAALALAEAALALASASYLPEAGPHEPIDPFWGRGAALAGLLPGALWLRSAPKTAEQ